MPEWLKGYSRQFLMVLIAVLLGSTATIEVFVDDEDQATPPKPIVTIPIELPGKDTTVVADRDQQLEPEELVEDAGAKGEKNAPELHEDMRDETPPGVSTKTLAKGAEKTTALTGREERTGVLQEPQRPAGAQNYSCPVSHVVNQSALNGTRKGVALHFTVSPPGSLLAIRGMFNTPSFGASSNFGFELFSLRCQEWVSIVRKAWAQGAANSAYVSIEIVTNDRSRASWLASPAFKRGVLASLVADLLKRTGAPPKTVDPQGCVWPAGVTDHDRLECGNSHWDVGRNFPWDVFMAQVRRAYYGANPVNASPLTKTETRIVKNAARPKATGHSRRYWCDRNADERGAIRKAARRRGGGGWRKRKRGDRYQLLGKAYAKSCR